MSRSKATKRRKVWLSQTVDGLSMYAMRAKADAKERAGKGGKPVPFVERLPGDVVLSREEVAEIRKRLTGIVERVELSNGAAAIDIAVVVTRLLRGRR